MATYLTRTQVTGSNRKIGTVSMWIKKTENSSGHEQYLFHSWNDGNNRFMIALQGDDTLQVRERSGGSTTLQIDTNRKFRDVNSWYHIVVRVDTTQGTAADRIRIYVNGVQETSFSGASYPSQNLDLRMGTSDYTFYLGEYGGGGNNFSGAASHWHFADGQSYAPTVFGNTDSTTGSWDLNTSPSVTYGNNGFFLFKDDNSVNDDSGEGHNFTLASGTLTKTEDCPSNIFATVNSLLGSNLIGSTVTFAAGNTNVEDPSGSASGVNPYFISTLAMPSKGKFYCELKPNSFSTSSGHSIGIFRTSYGNTSDITSSSNRIRYIFADTAYYTNKYGSNFQTGLTAISSGDIVGMAFDLDNGTLQYYVNGVARGNQITGVSSANDGYDYFFFASLESSSSGRYGRYYWNFGNGYFATTAVSSAGTNASGLGVFEYDVPTGYTALCTKGLNL